MHAHTHTLKNKLKNLLARVYIQLILNTSSLFKLTIIFKIFLFQIPLLAVQMCCPNMPYSILNFV